MASEPKRETRTERVQPGKISISRVTASHEGDYVKVHIHGIAQMKLTLEDYAYLVTGMGHVHGELTVYGESVTASTSAEPLRESGEGGDENG